MTYNEILSLDFFDKIFNNFIKPSDKTFKYTLSEFITETLSEFRKATKSMFYSFNFFKINNCLSGLFFSAE